MSSVVIYHIHHIIPKHMGGTDDPSNLIKLTVIEHARAHQLLYEQYGCWQDYLAWKGLSGYLGKEDIIKEKQRLNGKERAKQNFKGPKSEDHKKSLSRVGKSRPKVKCPHCEVVGTLNQMKQWHFNNCPNVTSIQRSSGPCSNKRREAISKARKNTSKVACIYCAKEMDPGNLKKYHNDKCKFKPVVN